MNYPKITLITPSYNLDTYLEQTILSVLSQNYPNLEYIIIDGGSTDNSVEIIKKYEDRITFWVSEKDNGMYHALQKGFERSTGEIMGWINADDILHPKSLFIVAELLSLPKVEWIQGLPTQINEKGGTVHTSASPNLNNLLNKSYQRDFSFIQQESTFWSRKLWQEAGGYINIDFKLAGDFELWMRFFRYETLYNANALVGAFRIRKMGQKSRDAIKEYVEEADVVVERERKYHVPIPLPVSEKTKRLIRIKKVIPKFIFTLRNKIQKTKEIISYPPTFEIKTNSKIYYDFTIQKFILKE